MITCQEDGIFQYNENDDLQFFLFLQLQTGFKKEKLSLKIQKKH